MNNVNSVLEKMSDFQPFLLQCVAATLLRPSTVAISRIHVLHQSLLFVSVLDLAPTPERSDFAEQVAEFCERVNRRPWCILRTKADVI